MSFWSGETLADELPGLIKPFDAKQIDCAAYTLRIGGEVYISPSNSREAAGTTRRTLGARESFVIPPGQFAFLLTEERVRIPSTAVGFISMKARIKFRGLVNVSGFHVDPGYNGHLVFSVFNAGPSTVHLARGDDCFLIWYASLDAESTYVRDAPALNGITSDLINPISGDVESLANLADRLDKVEHEHQLLKFGATILITLAVSLLARSCTQQAAQPNTSQIVSPAQPLGAASRPTATPVTVPAAPPASSTSGRTDSLHH